MDFQIDHRDEAILFQLELYITLFLPLTKKDSYNYTLLLNLETIVW